jgi:hypothetical protein
MKTICVGGDLAGFTKETHVYKPVGLANLVSKDEPVVLVCHGLSIYERESDSDVSLRLLPETREYNLHAIAIAHRDHGAGSFELDQVRKDLGNKCNKMFGLTRGWENLKDSQRDLIISFLESTDMAPSQPEVQKLLGFDSPVSRLALRVALEIALRELDGDAPTKRPGSALPLETLLGPVLALAQQEPSLASSVSGISRALTADRKCLPQEITQALSELRS